MPPTQLHGTPYQPSSPEKENSSYLSRSSQPGGNRSMAIAKVPFSLARKMPGTMPVGGKGDNWLGRVAGTGGRSSALLTSCYTRGEERPSKQRRKQNRRFPGTASKIQSKECNPGIDSTPVRKAGKSSISSIVHAFDVEEGAREEVFAVFALSPDVITWE